MDDPQSSSATLDEMWRALSAAGNEAFHRGNDDEARKLYLLALREAQRILSLAEAGGAAAIAIAPVLYTISCHNLAELERRAGHAPIAFEWLDRALSELVDIAQDVSLPMPLRTGAVAGLRPALSELIEHTGDDDSTDALVPVVARAMQAWSSIQSLASPEPHAARGRHLAS